MSIDLPSLPPIELTKKLARTIFPGVETLPSQMPTDFGGRVRWLIELAVNWCLLVLALVNLAAVFFDSTYVELRPEYQQYLPAVVTVYDRVKGIAPHRTTEDYMAASEKTFTLLHQTPPSPEAKAALTEMQGRSLTMVQEDPFAGAGLAGVFEQLKNRARRHMKLDSAKQALTAFWSESNLTPDRLAQEQAFYERSMRPLLARNYFRALGENGRPFDAFWLIDLCFVPLFVLEFLLRGFFGVRRRTYQSWKAFCVERWYDLVYVLPLFTYALPLPQGPLQLVRVFSVGYRMQRLGLINPMQVVERQNAKVINLITDIVNVKLLTNYQEGVRKFDLEAAMHSLTPAQQRQVETFIDRNVEMVVTRVVPAISPELSALVTRSAEQALERSPAYQQLQRTPMVGELIRQFLPALVKEVVGGTQVGLAQALTDAESKRLLQAMIAKLTDTLLREMAVVGTEKEVKALLVDMLEEQKKRLLA